MWQVRKHAVMAVYTDVSDAELAVFIAEYDLGEVLSCKGIAEGVENSNYLITTKTGPYILTLYEKRVRGSSVSAAIPVPFTGPRPRWQSFAAALRPTGGGGDFLARHVAEAPDS